MRFDSAFLDEIRARLPVSEVVRAKVKLKKEGREWRGLSPFNAEKTPSFFVNDQKGFWHDFSAGKHGDGFSFVMETEGISFVEAVERLAAQAGLPLPAKTSADEAQEKKRASLTEVMALAALFFERRLKEPAGREARAYLEARAIAPAAQAHFRLGFAPGDRYALRDALAAKGVGVEAMIETGLLIHGEGVPVPYDRFRNRLMFPICDRSGAVIAFGGRALEKDARSPSRDGRPDGHPVAKYLNSPETPLFHKGATLYNLHNARKAAHERGTVIAVEGYVDVIAMTTAGFPHVVAPLGTAMTEEQLELLWRMAEEPILCFDGDKAGAKAAFRAVEMALPLIGPGRTARFVTLPDGQDPDDLLRAGGVEAVERAMAAPVPLVEMLWRRETQDALIDTPERRAGLERRLKEAGDAIKDQALRRHYRRELSERLERLLGGARAPGWRPRGTLERGFRGSRDLRPGAPAGPVRISAALAASPLFTGEKPRVSPRECLILLILVNHPRLLADCAEELASLEFSTREAHALRNVLLESAFALAPEEEEDEAGALRLSIERAGLLPFLVRLEDQSAHANLWNVRRGAASDDAQVSLRQALALHRRASTLNRERLLIEERLASEPTPADEERLAENQRLLSALEGTEAALEGFGDVTGRAARGL
ncbi:MAG TPA: DNA primase [Methylocystis sp.]|nr:DNA primase [Methylocystis sp.]